MELGPGEMAQLSLLVLAEYSSSVPSIHTVAHNYNFSSIHTYVQAKYSHTKKTQTTSVKNNLLKSL